MHLRRLYYASDADVAVQVLCIVHARTVYAKYSPGPESVLLRVMHAAGR